MISGAAAKDTLAVLPFTGGDSDEGTTIAGWFSSDRGLQETFDLIPRTRIARAIENEQKFQISAGMTDPDTIAALGQQLGAKHVLAGKIGKLGNSNLLIISILNIDDLRQIAGDIQTYARIEDIWDKVPGMARNIIRATVIDSSRLEKLAVVPVDLGENVDSDVADTLAQILSINIVRSGKYAVYPRTQTLRQVQSEYDTQLSGITADENVVGIGKGENPRLVLAAVAGQVGNLTTFDAAIINLESGVQVRGHSARYQSLDDGIRTMEDLARELTGVSGFSDYYVSDDLTAIRDQAEAFVDGTEAPSRSAVKQPSGGSPMRPLGYGVLNLALGLGSFVQKDWGGGLTLLAGYGAAAGLIIWELSLDYDDDLAGIPGALGLGVAGLTALYGFVRPFMYQRSRVLVGVVDGIHLALVTENRNRAAVQLSYTIRF
jgi:hypothetical protein